MNELRQEECSASANQPRFSRADRAGLCLCIGMMLLPTRQLGASPIFNTNQSASVLVGNTTFGRSGANGAPGFGPQGLQNPSSSWSNGTKLIVADSLNNRVLIYNSIPTSAGAAADVVIGQPNMISNTYNQGGPAGANTLNNPGTVFSDGTRLFITDAANSRVLIFNTIPTTNNASADAVVGQADMSSMLANKGGAAGAKTLSGPTAGYTDGTKLFVADYGNNRILIYNTIPTANDASADVVVGQPDIASVLANQGGAAGAATLSGPNGVHASGTKLYIADFSNNRVLIYNTIPTANNASADVVVGQPDMASVFANQGGAVGANTLFSPTGVQVVGTKLLVDDYYNNRVLIFNAIPTANNASANRVIGQVDLTSNPPNWGGGAGASSLNSPSGIFSDGIKLYVADQANNRVLIFNSVPTANTALADVVVGQISMNSAVPNAGSGPTNASGLNNPWSTWSDGTRLFVADIGNNRVLIYNSIPTSNNAAADVVVGQPDMSQNSPNNDGNVGGSVGANRLYVPSGVYSDGTKLYIVDRGNNRVLIYNTIPAVNHASADIVVGQPNMTSGDYNQGGAAGANTLANPYGGIYSDGAKLYVADTNNSRVLIYNTIPASNNASADLAVGQPDMTSGDINQGGASPGANTLNSPGGVFVNGSKLFIADSFNHRVLIYNTIPSGNNASADVEVGQANMTSGDENQGAGPNMPGANTLGLPIRVFVNGTKLFITDNDNSRVLIYNTIPASNNASANAAIGQSSLTTVTNQGLVPAANSLLGPLAAIITAAGKLLVADSANNRVLIYDSLRPAAPGSFAGAAQGVSSITWTWADVADEDGFRVVSSTDGNMSGDLAADTLSFTELKLSTNTAYNRRVAAFNVAGPSTSTAVTRYTLAAPPTGFALAQVNSSSITASWAANGNPAGTSYRAQIWSAGGSTTSATVTTTSTTFTGLPLGGTYYMLVRAINGEGVLTEPSVTLATVTSTAGGANVGPGGTVSFSLPSGPVTFEIPQGTFPPGITLAVDVPASVPTASGNDLQALANTAIEIICSAQPSKPVSLTLSYANANTGGVDTNQLVVARYDDATGAWVQQISQVNPAGMTVVGTVSHFSIFQIMVSKPASDFKAVRVIPNPFRPAQGHVAMGIFNLPPNARVRIYTSAGALVKDLYADAAGQAVWDGTNQSGGKAVSGVYFAYAQGVGRKATFKVAIQR